MVKYMDYENCPRKNCNGKLKGEKKMIFIDMKII